MPHELHFRRVMSRFATGVTVVTSRTSEGAPCGLTVNAVSSLSLDPPLILVCLDLETASLACVCDAGAFAVSILDADQEEFAHRFSSGERAERFEEVPYRQEVTGSPVLGDALAWLDCHVREVHEAGDHAIVVGEVQACDVGRGEPLVFYGGAYHRMAP